MKYHIRIAWGCATNWWDHAHDYSGWVEAGTPCEALARGIAAVKAMTDIPTDPPLGAVQYEVTYPTRTERAGGLLDNCTPGEFFKRRTHKAP